MDNLVKKVNHGEPLAFEEARDLFAGMADGALTEAQTASVLISMRYRGEAADELAGLLSAMNKRKKPFSHNARKTIDTCGTGGDGKSTVNVSTAVGIILAAMGYSVVKHGNSAQSGKVGSADILASLGFDMEYEGTTPEEFFSRHNFVFMFAPRYHPALKNIGKVRREIKVPTIFNFAGPLLNPAEPTCQMMGINRRERLDFVAAAAQKAGRDNLAVYASRDGYDEVSSMEPTDCLTIRNGVQHRFEIDPADFFKPFPMPRVESADDAKRLFVEGISGGDERVASIFALNGALALLTMDELSMKEGYAAVMECIKTGAAASTLARLTGGAA